MKKVSILEVRAYVVAPGETGADYHNQSDKHWIIDLPIANPMSIYEEYRAKRTSWGINALGTVVVEVELDDGTVGIGCSIGGEPACFIIENILAGLSKVRTFMMWNCFGTKCGARRFHTAAKGSRCMRSAQWIWQFGGPPWEVTG